MTDTTRELAFGCENMGYSREETVDRITKAVLDLELSDYLNRSIFDLSSGEKQQIAIGSVYALLPKVYIFDEPSANLDYAATKRLAETMKRLKADGYTIIVVEHRFYYLRELLDRAYLIQDGRIIQSFTREQFCSLPDETRINTDCVQSIRTGGSKVSGQTGTQLQRWIECKQPLLCVQKGAGCFTEYQF